MFQCVDCNKIFDRPAVRVETHGLDGPPYEEWNCCPYCGGDCDVYKPTKVAIFLETLRGQGSVFLKGVPYPVTYENDDVYHLGMQNGHKVGIEKSLEGELYVIEGDEE